MEKIKTIIENLEISDKSKAVYKSIANRIGKHRMKLPLKKHENVDYVKQFLDENYEKDSTKLDVLNLIIVLRTAEKMETTKLKELRSVIQKSRINNNIAKMNSKGKDLFTLEQFNQEMDEAFSNGQYKKYIVNYLWSHYCVRNEDVNVNIVKSLKEVTEDNQNYLVIQGNKIKYIRNKYKTVKAYGKKEHLIEDPQFIQAVKKNGVGKLLGETKQIGNVLRRLTINKMGEADVCKMVIDHYYDKKDTEMINQMASSRGTSIAVIKSFYNINAEQDIIREI
jgi:hypothetical protein